MDELRQVPLPLQRYLEQLHGQVSSLQAGQVANYIPELSHARPDWFGIALVTLDGQVYQVGDTRQSFTIQSISKAIAYGLALSDHGVDYVMRKVGVEPSGDAFNSISLDPDTGQPCNPMINAGAIATAGMIQDRDGLPREQRMLDTLARYVGHPVSINQAVYRSESDTGHRNRALAHLLRNFNILEEDPDTALALYFKQCSMEVSCRDLAVMAACLANNGVNPITGVVALEERYVDKVLSVMGSCGMYDYSGNWLYRVGMPAKSGVGGGIVAVLPGQFGLAVFSPPLDELGNSVRGIRVCEQVSADFGLHLYQAASSTSASVLRVKYTGAQVGSRKTRRDTARECLDELGNAIRGYELQGDLMFGATQSVISELMKESLGGSYFIVDLKRVVGIHQAAARLWSQAIQTLHEQGKQLFFTGIHDKYSFTRDISQAVDETLAYEVFRFKDSDHALEWCEDQLLGSILADTDTGSRLELCDQALCQGLDSEELAALQATCQPANFRAGDTVFRRDEDADTLFFINQGAVEVVLKIDNLREKRLTTLSAGMSFGELAMLNRNKRTADVRAIDDSFCYALRFVDIRDTVRVKMLANLAAMLAARVDRDAAEIAALY